MQVQLNTSQKFVVDVTPATATGSPGADQGPVTWPIDGPAILTVITDPTNPYHAEFRGIEGVTGSCTITPTDISSDGSTITAPPIEVTVTNPPLAPATQLLEVIGPVVPQ